MGEIGYLSIKMVSALTIVLGLIFLMLHFGKNFLSKKMGLGNREDILKIISRTYLGPKKELVVVETSGDLLLLGVTEHNISLISKITSKVENNE